MQKILAVLAVSVAIAISATGQKVHPFGSAQSYMESKGSEEFRFVRVVGNALDTLDWSAVILLTADGAKDFVKTAIVQAAKDTFGGDVDVPTGFDSVVPEGTSLQRRVIKLMRDNGADEASITRQKTDYESNPITLKLRVVE